jgi:hypothetical protein
MPGFAELVMAAVLVGALYLGFSTNVKVKVWLRPAVSFVFAVFLGVFFGNFLSGDPSTSGPGYIIAAYIFGATGGAVVYQQFRFCKNCGLIRPTRLSLVAQMSREKPSDRCANCGHRFRDGD